MFASTHFVPLTGCFCEEAEAAIICASGSALCDFSSRPLFISTFVSFCSSAVSACLCSPPALQGDRRFTASAPACVYRAALCFVCLYIYKRVCVAASSASLASRGSIRERMRGGGICVYLLQPFTPFSVSLSCDPPLVAPVLPP